MPKKSIGGVRVVTVFGISVYLHWTWFIVLVFAVEYGKRHFHSTLWPVWSIAACLVLFTIVLLHEFGHALACRSVGGKAERIVLWPLGGLAIVKPPPRPGALLWSIVAGPLVNVLLVIPLLPLAMLFRNSEGDGAELALIAFAMNLTLLIFNLLPVYPLDGGQIVRALLWFIIGRGPSLAVSGWIGIVVAGAVGVLCLLRGEWYLALIAGFGALQSGVAIKQAKILQQRDRAPRYAGLACPTCHAPPPAGPFWRCSCGQQFDTFAHDATCPQCGQKYSLTACLECGTQAPIGKWQVALPLPPLAPQAVSA